MARAHDGQIYARSYGQRESKGLWRGACEGSLLSVERGICSRPDRIWQPIAPAGGESSSHRYTGVASSMKLEATDLIMEISAVPATLFASEVRRLLWRVAADC